jgi:hypothetical protein
MNAVPLIVRVCGAAPTWSEAGRSEVMLGTGLLGETEKLTGADEPPPGPGFVTTTEKELAVARSAAVSDVVS